LNLINFNPCSKVELHLLWICRLHNDSRTSDNRYNRHGMGSKGPNIFTDNSPLGYWRFYDWYLCGPQKRDREGSRIHWIQR